MKGTPFNRSMAMLSAFSAALSSGMTNLAMLGLPDYKSRGKGRGTKPRRFGNNAGRYQPHQGAGEIQRRRIKILAGKVSPLFRADATNERVR